MTLRTEAGSAKVPVLTNLAIRILQLAIGTVVLGIYGAQLHNKEWAAWGGSLKFSLGVAAGALALITAPILAALPFFLGYYVVAWAFVWDFIVMAVYAATFATFKNQFHPGTDYFDGYKKAAGKVGVSGKTVDLMGTAVWIDLIGMLLWLISFLIAVTCLVVSKVRGSSKQ